MDVVYVVGPTDRSEQLRYSLRSVAANLAHDRIWIAGHKPPWVTGVEHIPTRQRDSKYRNSTENLRAACQHPDVSDRFIYFNDDFFVMQQMARIPHVHLGGLGLWITRRPSGTYRRGAIQTKALLKANGVKDPVCYEIHAPMVIDKRRMLDVLDMGRKIRVFYKRTAYGNLAGYGGKKTVDMKVIGPQSECPTDMPFLSTSVESFRSGKAGKHIREQFPEVCQYEEA